MKNSSFSIKADVEIPAGGASGVILCQAGRFGGWSLYVKDDKPAFAYNWVGLKTYTVPGTERLAPGKATIRFDFAYDGGGRGKGGTGTLTVNGRKVGTGRIDHTNANVFSADEGADVGIDEGTNVTNAYKQHDNRFTGKIAKITISVDATKMTPEEKKAAQAADEAVAVSEQ